MKMDYLNGLLITVAADASLAVSKPLPNNNQGFEKIREVKNLFHGREITLLAISVYHNLIVTGTTFPTLLFWNFEFCKLAAVFTLEPDEDPSALQFINGF
jgi:hypothetical protein